MHLIICFAGKPGVRGFKMREFIYDPALSLFVWQGRKLTPEEFNKEAAGVFERNAIDLPVSARVIFEEGDATESGQILALNAKIKDLTERLSASNDAGGILSARVAELEALIGKPPEGLHADEAKPRSATWHQERLAWQGEVEALRLHCASLTEQLAGVAGKTSPEVPFARPAGKQGKPRTAVQPEPAATS